MGLATDLSNSVDDILSKSWDDRDGQVVPTTETVKLAGGAVKLSATILYADLADSTELAMNYDRRIAARVFKSYLSCCSRVIRARGGEIRSFDGDRVMGVFVGSRKNTEAAICALNIAHVFNEIIKPKLEAKYPKLKDGMYKLKQSVGIDTSEVLVIRGGVRDNNDLVWVGRAPNVAAKLSSVRESGYSSYITKEVYDKISDEAKYHPTDKTKLLWEKRSWSKVAGVETIYRSSWMKKP
jgi:adenylate cyclase